MDLMDCLKFLDQSGIPVARTRVLKAWPDSFPVVLKINTLEHKSEKDLVKIAHCPNEFGPAYEALKGKGEILAQDFASGIELILGIHYDETFGHVVMVGAGGVFTEILKDVAFRAVPLTRKDAKEMVEELKVFEVLQGFRGKTYNVEVLEDTLLKLSEIAKVNPNIKSLDINPFVLNDKKGQVVDCRLFLD